MEHPGPSLLTEISGVLCLEQRLNWVVTAPLKNDLGNLLVLVAACTKPTQLGSLTFGIVLFCNVEIRT